LLRIDYRGFGIYGAECRQIDEKYEAGLNAQP
jgi:hypothetical protein